jgi:hypothetical protein
MAHLQVTRNKRTFHFNPNGDFKKWGLRARVSELRQNQTGPYPRSPRCMSLGHTEYASHSDSIYVSKFRIVKPDPIQCPHQPPRFWDSFWKKIRSQPNWTNFGKIRMNFGLNSVNFRNVKRKIRFGPHRNGRISPKFGLIRSNPRTLPTARSI